MDTHFLEGVPQHSFLGNGFLKGVGFLGKGERVRGVLLVISFSGSLHAHLFRCKINYKSIINQRLRMRQREYQKWGIGGIIFQFIIGKYVYGWKICVCLETLKIGYILFQAAKISYRLLIGYVLQQAKWQQLEMMQEKKNRDELKLNSYKIDSRTLQSSLKELSHIKSDMETTISQYKATEETIREENNRLRQELKMLQKKNSEKVGHINCENKIRELREELVGKNEKLEEYKNMFEVEKRNTVEIQRFYENKLEKVANEQDSLIAKYQKKIQSLTAEILHLRSIRDKNGYEITPPHKFDTLEIQSDKSNSTKKEENLKLNQSKGTSPPYVKSQPNIRAARPEAPRSKTTQIIEQNHNSLQAEQMFQASIRRLYHEIKQLGMRSRDMLFLPQFKKMYSQADISRKDLVQFMKNPPIAERNLKNIENSVDHLERIVMDRYGQVQGKFVAETIVQKMQEYEEAENQIYSEDIEISGMTPTEREGKSSYGYSSISNSAVRF